MSDDLFCAFGLLINAMGGGGDVGQVFPESDANDLRYGARYIPGEVTIARRSGEQVTFDARSHKWTFRDGRVIE